MKPYMAVMELVTHGELLKYLSDHSHGITWCLRLKFALDIANGVNYLQSMELFFVVLFVRLLSIHNPFCPNLVAHRPPIAHIDLKSPNILLHALDHQAAVCAKIADFGTSQEIVTPIVDKIVDNPIWQGTEAGIDFSR
jgi:serine/threonine protein kinase